MNSGYITLPSNTKTDYDDNTTSSFRIDLTPPLELPGNYEVAIVEAIYKQSWLVDVGTISYNYSEVKTNKNWIIFNALFYDGENNMQFIERINFQLKSNILEHLYNIRYEYLKLIDQLDKNKVKELDLNHYPLSKYDSNLKNNKQSVVDHIKSTEKEYLNSPKLIYRANRLYLEFKTKTQTIKFEGDVVKILKIGYEGSEPDKEFNEKQFNAAENLSYMISSELFFNEGAHRLLGQMFIYSDIGAYQHVGNKKMPLLRQIVIDYKEIGQILHSEFLMPQYVRITKDEITSIQIKIRDIHGKKVMFENSHITIKLEYRRV